MPETTVLSPSSSSLRPGSEIQPEKATPPPETALPEERGLPPPESMPDVPESMPDVPEKSIPPPEPTPADDCVAFAALAWERALTRAERGKLLFWRKKFQERASPDPNAVIREAVSIAALADKRTALYADGILKRWFAAGLVSVSQIAESEARYQQTKARGKVEAPASRRRGRAPAAKEKNSDLSDYDRAYLN